MIHFFWKCFYIKMVICLRTTWIKSIGFPYFWMAPLTLMSSANGLMRVIRQQTNEYLLEWLGKNQQSVNQPLEVTLHDRESRYYVWRELLQQDGTDRQRTISHDVCFLYPTRLPITLLEIRVVLSSRWLLWSTASCGLFTAPSRKNAMFLLWLLTPQVLSLDLWLQ